MSIAAKLSAARHAELKPILIALFCITVVGWLLVFGYIFGYIQLKNIWIVTAVSLGSIIIIIEPMLTWFLFRQFHTPGALVGVLLGVTGILASLSF